MIKKISGFIFLFLIATVCLAEPQTWDQLVPDGCKSEDVIIKNCSNTQGTEKKECSITKSQGITYAHSKEHGITMDKTMEESKLKSGEFGVGASCDVMGLFSTEMDTRFREEVTKTSSTREGWSTSESIENGLSQGTEVTETVIAPPKSYTLMKGKVVKCGPFTVHFRDTDTETVVLEQPGLRVECEPQGDQTAHESDNSKYYLCNDGKKELKTCGPRRVFRINYGCSAA